MAILYELKISLIGTYLSKFRRLGLDVGVVGQLTTGWQGLVSINLWWRHHRAS